MSTLDPKLDAAALGVDREGVMIYLADHVEEDASPTRILRDGWGLRDLPFNR
ncbi:hypothetical protein ACIGQE_28225 [Streptomyces sp. NPDC053429]|uniref:hypothetical protein n=1 Tax=unclassified Streptomyces TaxID=2593676 RepID=UPI0034025155